MKLSTMLTRSALVTAVDIQQLAVMPDDRFQVSGTVEYFQRDNLKMNDVSFTECQTDYRRSAAKIRFGRFYRSSHR